MKITRIRALTVPLRSCIRNAQVSFAEMTGSIVVVDSDVVRQGRRLSGLGFGSIGRYASTAIITDRLIPRLMKASPADYVDARDGLDPMRAWEIMMRNEKPGGHGERSTAVGAVDMALWDLAAKIEDVPLWRLLANRYNAGCADEAVPVYAAGGYYKETNDVDALRREIAGHLAAGYSAVKIKIGGAPLADDLRRVRAAIAEAGDGCKVAVDANGRFDLATACSYASELAALGVRWFEEPGDPLDYTLQAELGARHPMPYAAGENLFSHQDVRNLVRHAGLRTGRDTLQMDPALSYGLPEYMRMLDVLRAAGWSPRSCVPHGGHQFSLHVAAGLQIGGNEAYPGVFQPFGGFGPDAVVKDGTVCPSATPGIGIEQKSDLMALFAPLLNGQVRKVHISSCL
ncbi:MAG: enolase C-terminal domain-like protein [Opitutaceae bacterium]